MFWPETALSVKLEMPSIKEIPYSKQIKGSPSPSLSPVDKVFSNDDLLTEILLRLPVSSLLRARYVCNQWYSLIASPRFSSRLNFKPNPPNPPSGFFRRRRGVSFLYDFVPLDLDTGNPLKRPPFTILNFDPDASGAIEILQSCNGLLLCHVGYVKFYVYNPTTSQFFTLPPLRHQGLRSFRGMTIAFDPSRSAHYKVVCIWDVAYGSNPRDNFVQMVIYSSETGHWRVSGKPFQDKHGTEFKSGVCCNDAIHWIHKNKGILYFKFDEESFAYIDVELLAMSDATYGFLFESRDNTLLVCSFRRYLEVCEIKKDYSGVSVKYHIDIHDGLVDAFPEMRPHLYHCFVGGVVLGETEEDSFIVFEIPGKSVRFNILSQTYQKLSDFPAPPSSQYYLNLSHFPTPFYSRWYACNNLYFPFIESLAGEEPVQILVYSSDTRNWRVSGKPFETGGFTHFSNGVCCNDEWPAMIPSVVEYFRFAEESLHYINIETHAIIGIEPHSDFLAESHNGMLLIGIFYSYTSQLDVLEMKEDYSGWSFKYHVDFDELCTPFAEMGGGNNYEFLQCLVAGKCEKDLFLVHKIPGKLLCYNIVLKTFRKHHEFVAGSARLITSQTVAASNSSLLYLVSNGILWLAFLVLM